MSPDAVMSLASRGGYAARRGACGPVAGVPGPAYTLPDLLYATYEHRLIAELDPERLPRHVAVLADGNRRWPGPTRRADR